MAKKQLGAIEEHFNKVSDPGIERTKQHKLIVIIVIGLTQNKQKTARYSA